MDMQFYELGSGINIINFDAFTITNYDSCTISDETYYLDRRDGTSLPYFMSYD